MSKGEHPRGNKKNPLTGVFACRAPQPDCPELMQDYFS